MDSSNVCTSNEALYKMLLHHIDNNENDETLSILQNLHSDDLKGKMGMNLLHSAVSSYNTVVIQQLIILGVKVDACNEFGITPLGLALSDISVNEKTIGMLLDLKADIYYHSHTNDDNKQSIFKKIISSNHYSWQIKSLFLERFKSDCSNNSEIVAEKLILLDVGICHAAYLKDIEVLRIMLSRGYSLFERDSDSKTVLHIGVFLKDLDLIKFSLQNGVDVNAQDKDRLIPLSLASEYGDSAEECEILDYLIDEGSSLASYIQKTYILISGKTTIVRKIMSRYNIDFNIRGYAGRTDLHFIAINSNICNDHFIIDQLQQCKIDVNVLSNRNESSLHAAAKSKNLRLVLFLLEKGANVNQQTVTDIAPIHAATKCCSLYSSMDAIEKENVQNLIKLLLQYGADPQLVTTRDITVFSNILHEKSYDFAKPILTYLVFYADRGGVITEMIRNQINSSQILREEFELYQRNLEEVKRVTFNDSSTIFNVMFDTEKKMLQIALKKKLVNQLVDLHETISSDSYFFDLLKKRLDKIFLAVEIRRKASGVLCQILKVNYNAIPGIIDKIVHYFDERDLQNIIQV